VTIYINGKHLHKSEKTLKGVIPHDGVKYRRTPQE
jgi:hypothetical protein